MSCCIFGHVYGVVAGSSASSSALTSISVPRPPSVENNHHNNNNHKKNNNGGKAAEKYTPAQLLAIAQWEKAPLTLLELSWMELRLAFITRFGTREQKKQVDLLVEQCPVEANAVVQCRDGCLEYAPAMFPPVLARRLFELSMRLVPFAALDDDA